MTAPMTASTLAATIDRLGPYWEHGRHLDATANRHRERPVMAGDTIRVGVDVRLWLVVAIDATNAVGDCERFRDGYRCWLPLDALEVVR